MKKTQLHLRPLLTGLACSALLLGAACGDDSSSDGDGTPADAGDVTNNDAGAETPDSGETTNMDSGVEPDAGVGPSDVGGLPEGTAPPARADTAYAVTPEGRMFMFFGDRAVPMRCNFPPSDFIEDAFAFNTVNGRWAPIEVQGAGPQARARAEGIWDEVNSQFVLFGGRWRAGTSGAYTFYGDVWGFNPASSAWTELSAAGIGKPTGRTLMALATDGAKMYMHGGDLNPSGLTLDCQNDTWSFDLATNQWEQLTTSGPTPPIRCFHSAVVARTQNRLYVFAGGGNGAFQGPFYDDLWYLDLGTNTWTQVAQSSPWPPARIRPGLDYDASGERLVMFGGHDNGFPSQGDLGPVNDLWTFDIGTETWTVLRTGDQFNTAIVDACNPPADFTIVENGVAQSPERRQSHLFFVRDGRGYTYGGKTDCGITNDTWSVDLSTGEWTLITESFRGLTCAHSTQPDCTAAGATYCGG